MNNHPYYISWTKQNGASEFPISKAQGVHVHSTLNDKEHKLIDMSSISYQAHFGHSPKVIIDEVKKQLDTIPLASPKGVYPHKDADTHALLNYMGKRDGKIFYTTGGAETVENALKIARDVSKKKIILARQNSYHGATLGALAATGDWRNQAILSPDDQKSWIARIPEPYDDPELIKTEEVIKNIGSDKIAGVIIETVTGGNGVIIPTKNWYQKLNALCKKYGLLFILDEVVCGFHRTGTAFGYMNYEVEPDLICMAKGISGGVIPFGALWTSQKIASFYDDEILVCGLTNYAHPIGVASMRGALKIVADKSFQNNLKVCIEIFHKRLQDFEKLPNVTTVRKIGMLSAIELSETIEWKIFFEAGVYLVSQNKRIILAPPLVINPSELNEAMDKIERVLKGSQNA